jgi:hypothetical protein
MVFVSAVHRHHRKGHTAFQQTYIQLDDLSIRTSFDPDGTKGSRAADAVPISGRDPTTCARMFPR